MVNKKFGATAFIIILVAVMFGFVMMEEFADSIFAQTTTLSVTNDSLTSPAINTATAIAGREIIGSAVVHNNTAGNGSVVPATNYTIESDIVNGQATVTLTILDSTWASTAINASYNYKPDGYLNLGSARSIVLLISIFAALGILIAVIVILLQKTPLGEFMGVR